MMDSQILVKEMTGNLTHQSSKESFTFSSCNDNCLTFRTDDYVTNYEHHHEHELFFDMDIALPFTWGDSHYPIDNHHLLDSHGNMGMGTSSYLPLETQEFEFSITFSDHMSSSNDIMGSLSPADDLFYKGQLLPLHLPPRLRMVERLSSLESNTSDEESINEECIPSACSQLINKDKYSLSCEGTLGEEGSIKRRPGATMVRSSCTWLDVTEVQNASVFPHCYKDPSLQMFQEDVNSVHGKRFARPSLSTWRVLLPGSRRKLSCRKLEIIDESFPGYGVRKAKEAQRWGGFSVLKLRASGSFFKSLFSAGELGRMHVHHKGHNKHYEGAKQQKEEEEEEEEEGQGRLNASYGKCREYRYGINKQPQKAANTEAPHERDKLMKKARQCLQKYLRLFKSMYVSLSHTHTHEQSRNFLLESPSMDMMSTCSSTRQGNVTVLESKPENKSLALTSATRTTSFSERPKRNGDTMQLVNMDCFHQSGMLTARLHNEGSGCILCRNSNCGSSSCDEVENRIQGAIAHCKQSSAHSS